MKFLGSLILVLLLVSCSGTGRPVNYNKFAEDKYDYEVTLLFEFDGQKIYRFLDAGSFHYFIIKSENFKSNEKSAKIINKIQKRYVSPGKTGYTEYWDDATIDQK